jgi:hypothetical protein
MRKCSVIIPVSRVAQVTTSFVSDLNEALSQMRGRQLQDVCITFPAGDSVPLEPFNRLCQGSNPVHCQLDTDASLISCVNKGLSHALGNGCDALVVIPGGIIAPETLSSLSSVGNSADNFGIVSARVYKVSDEDQADESEALYLYFLEQSAHLHEWQETRFPSPFCFFLALPLLRERPTLSNEYEYLNEALHNYSESSYSLGFRSLLHNKSFHSFPRSADESLYVLPPSPDVPSMCPEQTLPVCPLPGVTSAHVIKERLSKLSKNFTTSRPSLVVDLRQLPHCADPLFDLGIHIAAAVYSRLAWVTTLLVPSDEIAGMWGLSEKFPKAEILIGEPQCCYNYALYPTYPDSVGTLAAFVSLSPNSFFLLQEPFSRSRADTPQNDALSRIICSIAKGILLIGRSGESRFRANLPNRPLAPIHSLLPSQYFKDYQRNAQENKIERDQPVLICLPGIIPNYLIPVFSKFQSALGTALVRFLGTNIPPTGNCKSIPYTQLKCDEVYSMLSSSLFVVFPRLTEDLLLYLGRALSLGKIVITLENDLVQEFKDQWQGPKNLVLAPTIEELPSIIQTFLLKSERGRFIETHASDRGTQTNCKRWSQIGSAINEFFLSTSNKFPVTSEEFLNKQSLLSDFVYSTFHGYADEPSDNQKELNDAKLYITNLEDRIKKLEAAQLLLATHNDTEKKSTLLGAFSAIQGWGGRPKEKNK